MTAKEELQQTALQCAKYLKNMEGDGPKYLNVPTEHLTDYFSEGGKLPYVDRLESSLTIKDILFGPTDGENDEIPDEHILVGRGSDGFFEYTKTHTLQVIALALAYRFLDMKLPYNDVGVSHNSGDSGMYASEIEYIMEKYKHLKHILEPCLDIEYDYENDRETSFYEINFYTKDLALFKDDYCEDEEHICDLFLKDLENIPNSFKKFTIFSKIDDAFWVTKVSYAY